MLPSRGLRLRPRPIQLIPPASRQSPMIHGQARRKLSSLRTSGSSITPGRPNLFQCTRSQTSAVIKPNVVLTTAFVRNASWYTPWSWSKPNTPDAPMNQPPTSDTFAQEPVTSHTPELAPASIDKAPVVDYTISTTAETISDPKTVEDLLLVDPVQDTLPVETVQLIDHAGQLKELGLDYGIGMTSVFEKVIETIYLQTGIGWAGSIVASGIVVRFVTFYFQAQSSDRMAAMAALRPVTAPIQAKMEGAIAKGDKALAELYRQQQQVIMRPHVGGFMSMGGFMMIQAYIGFCAFRFLRAMGELPVPGMNQDGFLWFVDLTTRDPYYILPVATASIMYTVFRTVGETGVANEVGAGASRKKIVTLMAIVFGFVTSFQPAGLQLYFLNATCIGGCTGWLLRQNEFRRLIGIRILPSQQSNELYSKVVRGEMTLKDIKNPRARMKYQAPTPVNNRSVATLPGIRVKQGVALPEHLRPPPLAPKIDPTRPDRDYDFHEGPRGTLAQKLSYYRRNYRLKFMWRRFQDSWQKAAEKAGYADSKMTQEQARRKRKAEEYEIERRRRFENRR